MNDETFRALKHYVRFTPADEREIESLREPMMELVPRVVARFYEAIEASEPAMAVVRRSGVPVESLQRTFSNWLRELFGGAYDSAYVAQRSRIGQTHVRVGLPQWLMFAGMSVFRSQLNENVPRLGRPDPAAAVAAVNKLLDLELALMNDSYREDLVAHMQAIERSRMEERVSEAEHMAAIGRLAATLAHEIKNPLAGISAAMEVFRADFGDGHPHAEIFTEIMRQIDRLDSTVRDLLIYARPKKPECTRQDIGAVFNRVLLLFRRELCAREIELLSDAVTPGVMLDADETQLHRLFTNLLLNAAHACRPHGHIWCRVAPRDELGGARVEIEDDGEGIPADLLERVFEPFFTTKTAGTGLGLSICRRIVEQHGGTIRLRSDVGRGTCVTIELPSHQ